MQTVHRKTKMTQSNVSKVDKKKESSSLPTKVVIRRLPPSLTPESLIEQISPLPNHDFFYFVKADKSLGSNAFTRAYINFTNSEEIFNFRDKFDGYVFVDIKGNEYPAIVEFSPFQKVPKRKAKKPDAKKGTIEQDSDYQKFLKTLETPEEEEVKSLDTYLEDLEAREKELKANKGCRKTTTPLIEYLVRRREEKKANMMRMQEERKKRERERRLKDDDRRKRREREKELERSKPHREKTLESKAEQPVKVLMKNPDREKEVDKSTKTSEKSKDTSYGRDDEKRKEREKLRFSKENREKMKNEKFAGKQDIGKGGGRGDSGWKMEDKDGAKQGKSDRREQSRKEEVDRRDEKSYDDKKSRLVKDFDRRDRTQRDKDKFRDSERGKGRGDRDLDRKEIVSKDREKKEYGQENREKEKRDRVKGDTDKSFNDKKDKLKTEDDQTVHKSQSTAIDSLEKSQASDGDSGNQKDRSVGKKKDSKPSTDRDKEISTVRKISKEEEMKRAEETKKKEIGKDERCTPSPDANAMTRSGDSLEDGRPGSGGSEASETSTADEKRRKRRERPEREIYDPRKAAERRRLGQTIDAKSKSADHKSKDEKGMSRQGSTDSKKTVSRQNSDESKKLVSRQNSNDSNKSLKSLSRQNSEEEKSNSTHMDKNENAKVTSCKEEGEIENSNVISKDECGSQIEVISSEQGKDACDAKTSVEAFTKDDTSVTAESSQNKGLESEELAFNIDQALCNVSDFKECETKSPSVDATVDLSSDVDLPNKDYDSVNDTVDDSEYVEDNMPNRMEDSSNIKEDTSAIQHQEDEGTAV